MPGPGQTLARRALDDALRPREDRVTPSEESDRYRLDPWAHCDAGHVKVLDLETLEEVEFHPWPHQREVGDTWIDRDQLALGRLIYRNVHEEKSRQMGISWDLAWLDLWATYYWGIPGLVLHQEFSAVDDGGSGSTPDSYFGRMRFIHDRMPVQHQQPLLFTMGLVRHLHRSSAFMVAEGATPDPGRGKRYGRGVIDEAARISFGEAAQKALTRAIPNGRLYNSTPKGEGNFYFRIRDTRPGTFRFLRHHWSVHPIYAVGLHVAGQLDTCPQCKAIMDGVAWNPEDTVERQDLPPLVRTQPRVHRFKGRLTSPWYENAILEMTEQGVAEELDIDYAGALTARVYPEFSPDRHVVEEIPYDPAWPIEFAIDYGLDATSVIFFQDAADSLRAIGELEIGELFDERAATPDVVAPEIVETLFDLGVPLRLLNKEWLQQMYAVGDPAGEGRSLSSGLPLTRDYRRHGFVIRSPRHYTVPQTITALKRLLLGKPKPFRVCATKCPRLIRHLKNNVRPTDKTGEPKPGPFHPVDDEHNHACRAFAYYVCRKWPHLAAADPSTHSPPPPVEPLKGGRRNRTGRITEHRYGEKG